MSSSPLAAAPPRGHPLPGAGRRLSLGRHLVRSGQVAAETILRIEAGLIRQEADLGHALVAEGRLDASDLALAQARRCDSIVPDLVADPPDARLIDAYGAAAALRDRLLPWRRLGAATVIVVTDPAVFHARRVALTRLYGTVRMAFASEEALQTALMGQRRLAIARLAEARVMPQESCRHLWHDRGPAILLMLLAALAALALFAPGPVLATLAGWAIFTLFLTVGLRAVAGIAHLTRRAAFVTARSDPAPARLPCVSLLVPLFREGEIAAHLLTRLDRLEYPRALLDVILICEDSDTLTRAAIGKAGLPPWMRLVTVPPGTLQTKPRALNYALDFARGSIIGVYDAEDAPAPDQIARVVERFHHCRPDVACLQGVLDFYNPRQNWLARCFAVDYATWFRILLPGMARMGLVIPLGGTTLFFRRAAIEALGGWDAHNVTEDADLGIRLARRGFRTELIATVTEEEANCHLWPWVKQRSRWLKGYAVTWAVHMRAPRRLWSDLGPWRFLGVQILLLGTLSQFILAPVLWSFWLLPLGLPHPLSGVVPDGLMIGFAATFLLAEVTNIALGCAAVSGPRHRWLMPWVPTLHFYWPLGAIASYKALWELAANPFYWDKTAHGRAAGGKRP